MNEVNEDKLSKMIPSQKCFEELDPSDESIVADDRIIKEVIISKDTTANIADIICWMRGYIEAKGEDWDQSWLADSLRDVSDVNSQLK